VAHVLKKLVLSVAAYFLHVTDGTDATATAGCAVDIG
jgi:hypothetical protein